MNVVSVEQLQAVANMAVKPETKRQTNGSSRNGFSRLMIPEWLREKGVGFNMKEKQPKGRDIHVLHEYPFNPEHKNDDARQKLKRLYPKIKT